jgi:hypothetical protein
VWPICPPNSPVGGRINQHARNRYYIAKGVRLFRQFIDGSNFHPTTAALEKFKQALYRRLVPSPSWINPT